MVLVCVLSPRLPVLVWFPTIVRLSFNQTEALQCCSIFFFWSFFCHTEDCGGRGWNNCHSGPNSEERLWNSCRKTCRWPLCGKWEFLSFFVIFFFVLCVNILFNILNGVFIYLFIWKRHDKRCLSIYFQVKLHLFIFVSKILVIHGVNLWKWSCVALWRELLFLIKHVGIHLISLILSTENRRFSFQCD